LGGDGGKRCRRERETERERENERERREAMPLSLGACSARAGRRRSGREERMGRAREKRPTAKRDAIYTFSERTDLVGGGFSWREFEKDFLEFNLDTLTLGT
jgi:hypothetical protein